MLIVQISDAHCGPMFNYGSFRTAMDEINALSPDAVVVTGNITENGILSEFKMAAEEFKRLKAKNVIYIIGNHDYRSTGYLLFKQFFPFNQVTEIGDAVIIVLSSAAQIETTARLDTDRTFGLKTRLKIIRTA